jgi:phytoene dehydrogenase-like protein
MSMGKRADSAEVVIVGAGLAGLACAKTLAEAGIEAVVVEASDGVGGRVRTDVVDGFLLDRGFQVLLRAYPAAQELLDLDALDLCAFVPGAQVWDGSSMSVVSDPIRRPLSLISTVTAPIGSLTDKVRIARLRAHAAGSPDAAWKRPESSTREYLRAYGFSDKVVDRFFRPLYGGIFLDASLQTSSRMFEYIFAMLASGDSCVPAKGMQAIPDQLAARLPSGSIRLRTRVTDVRADGVTLQDGTTIRTRATVVATDGPGASALLAPTGGIATVTSNPVSCVYFAAGRSPVDQPIIVLNGAGDGGPVNNLAVMSKVSAAYAPPGQQLIAAAVLGHQVATPAADAALQEAVRAQLGGWFGTAAVKDWRHVRTVHVDNAQPKLTSLVPHERPVTVNAGVFVAGDHRDQASIQGALSSGRRCAQAVLAAR